ncbi:hypothetical protein Tsubulata_050209 [Turnera subulata]|uniref:MSP domain-containing protein n=1 Tax=Turnera subulata TaxID=218843 RepID=A0A9Q0FPC5_9ROSI|nr:hypothetical protein Tsubulata_050209 [Turnera subulata]
MATSTLLDIHPLELKFTFVLNKQSSCTIQLMNKSDQYVAFKVKTTSPTKYHVRTNLGLIMPKGTCDVTVTMQAQKVAPANLQCKDKFLIQSTAVALGTDEEDNTLDMIRQSGKRIGEKKLDVILVSPPHSQALLPNNAELKKDPNRDLFCFQTNSTFLPREPEELKSKLTQQNSYPVTRQSQTVAPPNMQCNDKFLIQFNRAPFRITEKDIIANMV